MIRPHRLSGMWVAWASAVTVIACVKYVIMTMGWLVPPRWPRDGELAVIEKGVQGAGVQRQAEPIYTHHSSSYRHCSSFSSHFFLYYCLSHASLYTLFVHRTCLRASFRDEQTRVLSTRLNFSLLLLAGLSLLFAWVVAHYSLICLLHHFVQCLLVWS